MPQAHNVLLLERLPVKDPQFRLLSIHNRTIGALQAAERQLLQGPRPQLVRGNEDVFVPYPHRGVAVSLGIDVISGRAIGEAFGIEPLREVFTVLRSDGETTNLVVVVTHA